jgi:hypothetical protein
MPRACPLEHGIPTSFRFALSHVAAPARVGTAMAADIMLFTAGASISQARRAAAGAA